MVFGGRVLAAEATPGTSAQKISDFLVGIRKSNNGYLCRDASEEDIELFFSKLDQVDIAKVEWPELMKNSRYPIHLKSIALIQEWETALSKFYSFV